MARILLKTLLAFAVAAAGCSSTACRTAPGGPAGETPYFNERFGYLRVGVGFAGLPGCDDIRPGSSVTITLPVMGALCIGASAGLAGVYAHNHVWSAIAETTNGDEFSAFLAALPFLPLAGLGHEGFMTTGCYDVASRNDIFRGVSWDGMFAVALPEDLSSGGGVEVLSAALGAKFIGGLWEQAFWNLQVGFQLSLMDFDARPTALNHGLYGGIGVEFALDVDVKLSAEARYALMAGDMSEYDYWDFTVGFSVYW
ncbi:MAG: hypothetical protein JW909_11835 [Planctomycetes bacterium]|nr:hypothetical protein [Planctomycetota bacterium]